MAVAIEMCYGVRKRGPACEACSSVASGKHIRCEGRGRRGGVRDDPAHILGLGRHGDASSLESTRKFSVPAGVMF